LSRKFYATIGLDEEVMVALKEKAGLDDRSLSSMVNRILREHFKLKGEKQWQLKFPED
jgi:hypothetical protein